MCGTGCTHFILVDVINLMLGYHFASLSLLHPTTKYFPQHPFLTTLTHSVCFPKWKTKKKHKNDVIMVLYAVTPSLN